MSGNGAYLFLRIDLPNDEPSKELVRRVLMGLAARYDTEHAHVDLLPFDAVRICKLIGTTARKGDDLRGVDGIEDRPHRETWYEPPQGALIPVPIDLLEAVAVPVQDVPQKSAEGNNSNGTPSTAYDRYLKYILKRPDAINGQGGHNSTFNVACDGVRFDLSDAEILQGLREYNSSKTGGDPWNEKQMAHKVADARTKVEAAGERGRFNQNADRNGRGGQTGDSRAEKEEPFDHYPKILSGNELIRTYPDRRPPVVDGLVREGDVANIIAAPKVGKSWLALGLAASVAAGRKWLNCFDATQGRVLYIDNELHPTDTAFRMREVAREMKLPANVMEEWFHVVSFRGVPAELLAVLAWLRHSLSAQQPGYYKLAIVDTLSKMLAGDKSENDNLYIR